MSGSHLGPASAFHRHRREATSQAAMLAHGMTIDTPEPALVDRLRQAAAQTVAAWVQRAGPDRAAVLIR